MNSVEKKLNAIQSIHLQDNTTLFNMFQHAHSLVAFNARATSNQYHHPSDHLLFPDVLYNEGQGFDLTTGDFTAPLSGVYFLIFHTRAFGDWQNTYMKMEGDVISRCAGGQIKGHATCPATVHMQKGQKAWVEPIGSSHLYQGSNTYFSGFLFHADP